jgi:hypothetical protein
MHAADRREFKKGPWIVRWSPPTKAKNFLGLMSAGFSCSFCLQDTYTFLLPKNCFRPGMGTFRAYPSSSPKKDKIIREGNDIICNYEPNAAKDMDIPFDNVSLGQFIRICGTSVDSCFKRARSPFF